MKPLINSPLLLLMLLYATASPVFVSEYYLKDHLGNTRVSFLGKTLPGNAIEITGKTDYYPFGLAMSQYSTNIGSDFSKNKYLYNGKEIQDDKLNETFFGWLDYGARFYDPQIGRWHSVDPMTEKYYNFNPYCYNTNDPVLLNDLDGKDFDPSKITDKKQIAALNDLLKTEAGRKLIMQFMHKDQAIKIKLGENTYIYKATEEGSRSNDLLTIKSEESLGTVIKSDGSVERTIGLTDISEKENSKFVAIGDNDKDYDISKGVNIWIRLAEGYSQEKSLNTLAHEMFVHVQPNIKRLENIEKQVFNGQLKPGSEAYYAQLQRILYSGMPDHRRLSQGQFVNFSNFAAQIDKINNNNIQTELYKNDVKNHK